jgi:Epoxide hydrolase N terminus
VKIRPFHISIPTSEILDLRRRLEQTRWPAQISEAGWIQGMDSGFLRSLVDYWLNSFDWNSVEAALNTVPHFEAISADQVGYERLYNSRSMGGPDASPRLSKVHCARRRPRSRCFHSLRITSPRSLDWSSSELHSRLLPTEHTRSSRAYRGRSGIRWAPSRVARTRGRVFTYTGD